MKFKETYLHSWIAAIDSYTGTDDLLCLTKSKAIENPAHYALSVGTTVNKIRNLPFIKNNMIGDILIASPSARDFLSSQLADGMQVIPCTIRCRDGEVEDYSIVHTTYCERIVDEDNSEKIFAGKSDRYFIGKLALYEGCEVLISKSAVRDCMNGNQLFFTEELAQDMKKNKLDKFISFAPLKSYKQA